MSEKLGLGKLITTEQGRDAIHVAVVPMEAAFKLAPGQHVGVMEDGRICDVEPHIGVVDPYLKDVVLAGEKCWLFLYPGSITGLRHDWSHPFDDWLNKKQNDTKAMEESQKWLGEFASEVELSYDELIEGAHAYIKSGEYIGIGFDTPDRAYSDAPEFWNHFEKVTGVKYVGDRSQTFFSCSC